MKHDLKVVKREPLRHTEAEAREFDEYFWRRVDPGYGPEDKDEGDEGDGVAGDRVGEDEAGDGEGESHVSDTAANIARLTAELRSRYE